MPPRPIFGAGGIGTTATSFTYKFDDAKKTTELLDRLKQLNILELDSAASYPPGNPWCAHRLLGECSAAERGFLIHDKIARHMPGPRLDDEHITASLNRSLELLRVERLPVLYAHDPDPLTPLEITAAAFDCQYKAGKFNEVWQFRFLAFLLSCKYHWRYPNRLLFILANPNLDEYITT